MNEESDKNLMQRLEDRGALDEKERAQIRALLRFGHILVTTGHVIRTITKFLWNVFKVTASAIITISGAMAAYAALKGKWPW